MSNYRRIYVPGGTYFFTAVGYQRRPIFATPNARDCFHQAIDHVRQHWPFNLLAIVLLPNHVHSVWTLPPGDYNYSTRWRLIKEFFTRATLSQGASEAERSDSRIRKQERAIWQRRFWEHTVRDEDDLKRCIDYIHWNPRKHQLVRQVKNWPWSSFHRYVKLQEYGIDWGGEDPTPGYDTPEWD